MNNITLEQLDDPNSEITPEMLFGEDEAKINTEDVLALMDETIEEVSIKDLPPPPGVSKETVEGAKSPKLDTKIYGYKEMAEQILSMPEQEKIPTFIEELDEMLEGGLVAGELLALTAITKHGKTTLAQTITYLQSCVKIPALWFTMEMSWQELTRKFMAMDSEYLAFKNVANLPLFYPMEHRGTNMEWIESQIEKAKKQFGVKMVVIDHLHFLLPLSAGENNTSFMVGEVVRQVKAIARRQNIPIILICHTKKLEVNVMPDLNSMRDSSFIAQESDFTLILWRERVDMGRRRKNDDILDQKDIFTGRSICSLEANRRNGKTGRFALGMINGRFHDFNNYLFIKREAEGNELVNNMNSEDAMLEVIKRTMEKPAPPVQQTIV